MTPTTATWTNTHGDTFTVGSEVKWSRRDRIISAATIAGACPGTGRPVIRAADLFDRDVFDTYTVSPDDLRDPQAFWRGVAA